MSEEQTNVDWSSIKTEEMGEWSCELFGMQGWVILMPPKGKEPNWFWRKMQYLIFGNKWVRNK